MSIVNLYGQDANGNLVPVRVDSVGALTAAAPTATPWNYAAAASGLVNTAVAVTIAAAGGAGLRSYINAIQVSADALTVATELVIRDGANGTVLWRTKLGTAGLINGLSISFPTALRSSPNTLLEVATLTATVAGAVYFNAQGYVGA